MTSRQLSASAILTTVATLTLAVVILWHYIIEALVGYTVIRLAWAWARKELGIKHRPRTSWSSLGRTAALLFAAWNTRWIKPHTVRASVPAKAGSEHRPEGWGT